MQKVVLPQIPHRMTLEEFRELAEGPPFFELIDGELIMPAPPNLFHQEIVGNVYALLRQHAVGHSLGKVFTPILKSRVRNTGGCGQGTYFILSDIIFEKRTIAPVDVQLGQDCFEPDVIFASSDRLNQIARNAGLEGPPDLLVEVLVESTYRRDLTRKRTKYAAAGVAEYWIIDPEEKTVRRFDFPANQEHPVAIYSEGASFTSPLVPGLNILVSEIFRR